MDGKALPELHDENYHFVPGAVVTLREGDSLALVATGSTVHEIVDAAALLADSGIQATVVSVPSIRPCDTKALLAAVKGCKAVITVEEHNINGGLGSPVAEVLAEAGTGAVLKRLGSRMVNTRQRPIAAGCASIMVLMPGRLRPVRGNALKVSALPR